MRQLTSDEWLAGPATGFNGLFKALDPFAEPLRDEVAVRTLLYPVSYLLEELEFEAVMSAAQKEGDSHVILSVTEEFGESGGAMAHHWEVSRWGYTEYRDLGRVGVLENAVYSPAGRWGILISHEQHAVVAGTERFLSTLFEVNPAWYASLPTFVKDWKYRQQAHKADVSWIPTVLRHVYGSASAWLDQRQQ